MPSVRTTIRIDDDLYRSVKEQAARSGRSVSAVLEDAVRRGLAPESPPRRRPFRIEPIGSGGTLPGVDLSSNAAMAEVMGADEAFG